MQVHNSKPPTRVVCVCHTVVVVSRSFVYVVVLAVWGSWGEERGRDVTVVHEETLPFLE